MKTTLTIGKKYCAGTLTLAGWTHADRLPADVLAAMHPGDYFENDGTYTGPLEIAIGDGRTVPGVEPLFLVGGLDGELPHQTDLETFDGLTVYDLGPAGDNLAVAGPDGVDPRTIDPKNLPEGFRWLDDSEWEELRSCD